MCRRAFPGDVPFRRSVVVGAEGARLCHPHLLGPVYTTCLTSLAMASQDTSRLVVNGLDVTTLDDDDLYIRLKDLGSPVGPIVDTTRAVYQKKLFVLLGGHLPESPTFNGDVDQEDEEYSDSEPEMIMDSAKHTHNQVFTQSSRTAFTTTAASATVAPPSQLSDVRKRMWLSSDGDGIDSSEIMYDPDLHTPSPRRSLRTMSSSTSETTTYHRMGPSSSSSRKFTPEGKGTVSNSSGTEKMSSALRLLVKLLFLALLIGVALYLYQNNPTESPFKAIEDLARQALEAAAGEEGVASPESVNQPASPPPPAKEPATNN